MALSLHELSVRSGVSSSHLARIETGVRFPSARVLQKIAWPLALDEVELLTSAGYLSPQSQLTAETKGNLTRGGLDPYVARVLAREPVEVQRAVIGIITILRAAPEEQGEKMVNKKLANLCSTVASSGYLRKERAA